MLLVPPSPMLDTEIAAAAVGVSKIYGKGDTEVRALDDISVSFGEGQFTAMYSLPSVFTGSNNDASFEYTLELFKGLNW